MHIEPGIVHGAKMVLAYGTAAAAGGYMLMQAREAAARIGWVTLGLQAVISTALVFLFFEVFPHFPVGVSEVHFILGTTIFLLFGPAAAAMGLAGGLAIQGFLFAPSDLPMYFVNVTTLLVPLFVIEGLAKRVVPAGTAYVDLRYTDVLKLSLAYQGGIVAWVAFWTLYGSGMEMTSSILTFGAAYMLVVVIEPIADLAVLAGAKALKDHGFSIFTPRLHNAA